MRRAEQRRDESSKTKRAVEASREEQRREEKRREPARPARLRSSTREEVDTSAAPGQTVKYKKIIYRDAQFNVTAYAEELDEEGATIKAIEELAAEYGIELEDLENTTINLDYIAS